MKKQPAKKKAGRPATGKTSGKPNITIDLILQAECQAAALRIGRSYSKWVEHAMAKELGRQQVTEEIKAETCPMIVGLDALEPAKTKKQK